MRPTLAPVWTLAGVSILLALAAGPVYEFAEATAGQLLDRQGYIDAVLLKTGGALPREVPGS